jgi:glucose uptake protein
MFLIENYGWALFACVFCMTCWGSWSNTQKLAAKTWRFELFYWDYQIGLVITALLWGFTAGTFGNQGRTFLEDLGQVDLRSVGWAMAGGAVWNIGNLLFVMAIALAGMAVAFPIGGGIAWLGGILLNYFQENQAEALSPLQKTMLFSGVAICFVAIYLSMVAYKKLAAHQKKPSTLGIVLSVIAGVFFAFFYVFVIKSLDPAFGTAGGTGNLGPYSGVLFFTLGAFATTVLFNPIVMAKPVQGEPVNFKQYFAGGFKTHLIGGLGGLIWASGLAVSLMAVGSADPAIGYAISNASPVVAILWGVFVWKEFKGAPKGTNRILAIMFTLFLVALVVIGASKKIGGNTDATDPNAVASVVAPAENYELPTLIIE